MAERARDRERYEEQHMRRVQPSKAELRALHLASRASRAGGGANDALGLGLPSASHAALLLEPNEVCCASI